MSTSGTKSEAPARTYTAATVQDVMTKDVVTVRSFATFREIAAVMLSRGVGAMPVVDSIGHPIGMVSRTDLIAKEAAVAEGSQLWELLSRRGRDVQARGEATTAAQLMTTRVFAITADTTLARAAYLMERHEVTHLPVVDGRNVVIGLVARSDLIRAYLRDDAEIKADVQRALSRALTETDVVEAHVRHGIVTLTGTVARAADAAEATRAAYTVDGLVSVIDKLESPKREKRVHDQFNPGPVF
jgi:CBS domain-containing protein